MPGLRERAFDDLLAEADVDAPYEAGKRLAATFVPDAPDSRRAQIAAYRVMDEGDLLSLEPVVIAPGWLDRRRVRVACEACGEGVNYQRKLAVGGRVLCRACAGEDYYEAYEGDHNGFVTRFT
jgi:formylmethanofuran dehydrogenase subunit E